MLSVDDVFEIINPDRPDWTKGWWTVTEVLKDGYKVESYVG